MKIWVLSTTRGPTAWTTPELARKELVRVQLEEQREELEQLEEGQVRYRGWLDWFDGLGPRPERTVWEVARLDQHPEWPARPEIMAELRLSISMRSETEAARIVETRKLLADLEKGIPFEDWGFAIFEWTLDTDELQAFESWD